MAQLQLQPVPSMSAGEELNRKPDDPDTEKEDSANTPKRKLGVVAAALCCCLAAVASAGVYVVVKHTKTAESVSAIDSYVLPNDRVHVVHANNSFLEGIFTANSKQPGEIRFTFTSDYRTRKISFKASNPEVLVNVVQFKGFQVDVFPKKLFFVLCPSRGGMNHPIEISNSTNLNSTGVSMLQEFMDSLVATYFVQLSVKLGVWGYTGANNSAAAAIHNLAKIFVKGTIIAVAPISNETVFRANQVVSATQNLGRPPESVEEIKANSQSGVRRRLGVVCSCTLSNTCGNPCYGMCGRDCSCWSWVCGGCGCFPECQQHDWYCSCDSMWNFWCLNVFWVGCGCATW